MIKAVIVAISDAMEIHTEGVLNVLPVALASRLRLSVGET